MLKQTALLQVIQQESLKGKYKMQETPLVSICCLAYNHEKYIKEAIEGFLIQKTDFPFEIIIHDDASTDQTAEIIRKYESQHPALFNNIYQVENKFSQGIKPTTNFLYPRARGKYIALCEGDDFWTDPLKLQKQVDFLEANEDYSGAAHQSNVIYSDYSKASNLFKTNIPEIITLTDLLGSRIFHTASFVFKASIVKNDHLPSNITAGDRAITLLVATKGKIHFSNDVMCIYRKHDEGISHWVTSDLMEKDLKMVPWLKSIYPSFPKHKYYSFIHQTILKYPKHLSETTVIKHSLWYIFHSFYMFPKNLKPIYRFVFYELPNIWKKTTQQNLL